MWGVSCTTIHKLPWHFSISSSSLRLVFSLGNHLLGNDLAAGSFFTDFVTFSDWTVSDTFKALIILNYFC